MIEIEMNKKNIESNIILKVIFNICFLFLIVDFFINICLPMPFAKGLVWRGILNIGYLIIFCIDIIFLINYFHDCKERLIRIFFENKWILFFLSSYFVWDLINFIYADHFEYAAGKLLSITEFVIILINFMLYVSLNHIDKVFLCLGLTALGISSVYIIGFVTGDYCFYLRKISALPDYNVASTAILLGTVANFYIAIKRTETLNWRICLLLLNLILNVPVVLLSGSRKNLIIVCGVIAFYLILFLGKVIYQMKKAPGIKGRIKKGVLLFAGMFSICSMGVMVFGLKDYSDKRYEQYLMGNYKWSRYSDKSTGNTSDDSGEIVRETDLKDRYGSIRTGESSDSRMLIWGASIEWIKEMPLLEKIIGGGNSHNSEVFDDLKHPINKDVKEMYQGLDGESNNWLYPHNVLLGDMLDGGVIKIILLLGVIVSIMCKVCMSIFYKSEMGFAVLWIGGTVLIMLMTSGHLGLFGNKFFWVPVSFALGMEQKTSMD